jgi:hypothetical protein
MVLDQVALTNFNTQYKTAYDKWLFDVQTALLDPSKANTVGPAKSRVDAVLTAWRAAVDDARKLSDATTANSSFIDELSRISSQVATERDNLRQLQAKQGTRTDQVKSVNPKITQSPYVNILGLRRNFRHSTRVGLIVATSVFGILALGLLGYASYSALSK